MNITKKIKSELHFFSRLRNGGSWIFAGVILDIFSLLSRYFSTNEIAGELGIVLGLAGWLCIVFGSMKYAKAKSLSEYLGLLGYLGLIIIFFMKPKGKTVTSQNQSKPLNLFNYVLLGLLTFGIISLTQDVIYASVLKQPNFDNLFPGQSILSICFVIIIPIVLTVFNYRKLISLPIWISLLFFLIWFFSINQDQLIKVYQATRSITFLYFTLYAILHVIVHGVIKMKKKTRRVFTPTGVFQWYLIMLTTIFLYAIYELLGKLF